MSLCFCASCCAPAGISGQMLLSFLLLNLDRSSSLVSCCWSFYICIWDCSSRLPWDKATHLKCGHFNLLIGITALTEHMELSLRFGAFAAKFSLGTAEHKLINHPKLCMGEVCRIAGLLQEKHFFQSTCTRHDIFLKHLFFFCLVATARGSC